MKQPNVSCLVLSRRLMREVQAVADRIPHKHKYSYGTELRGLTMKVWTLLTLAWQSKAQRAVYLELSLPLYVNISTYGETFSWHDTTSGWSAWPNLHSLAADETALHETEDGTLRQIWRPRHQGLRTLAFVRELPFRYGRKAARHHAGSERQRWPLRAIELPMDIAERKLSQPFRQSATHAKSAGKDFGRMGGINRPHPRNLARSCPHGLDGRADSHDTIADAHIQSRTDHQGHQQAADRMVQGTWHQRTHSPASHHQAGTDTRASLEAITVHARLNLKLQPLASSCDFLGYVLYPTHTRVRRRVVQHFREKLWIWQRQHVSAGRITATPEQFRQIKSVSASYEGHFTHADTRGLRDDFNRRYPWLSSVQAKRRFSHKLEGQQIAINFKDAA